MCTDTIWQNPTKKRRWILHFCGQSLACTAGQSRSECETFLDWNPGVNFHNKRICRFRMSQSYCSDERLLKPEKGLCLSSELVSIKYQQTWVKGWTSYKVGKGRERWGVGSEVWCLWGLASKWGHWPWIWEPHDQESQFSLRSLGHTWHD